ncbi:M16 family metallopeptidase [Fluviispira vulneris]|uniref:M16 family metallopeptidase n=1 Tax=Fluviispira vulneris TaxID=2763012 RepID=UPI0016462E3A|nr:insulinase family protein [Fluviispira vulneris]
MNFKIISLLLSCATFPSAFSQDSLKSIRPAVSIKPVELDWRSIKWPSINYTRIPVDGGAAIYSLHSSTALKFKVTFVFSGGVYAFPESERTAFGAFSDLITLGGFGDLNFDQIQNYTTEYGINIRSSITPLGQFVITADALSEDFPRLLSLVNNMILKPKFEEKALDLWKQQSIDAFNNLMDSNTIEKQYRFIDIEATKLAFGKEHYFAKSIERVSPSVIKKVTYDQIKNIYKRTISKNGLNVSISGSFTQKDFDSLRQLVGKIPYLEPSIKTWYPSRKMNTQNAKKINTVIIKKSDMSQSTVSLRYYYPKFGKLNSIETTQFDILEEIFSSTGGVIGNDRFSKAMRADSGISYSPHAYFNDTLLFPNTDVGVFYLNFQSPNERIAEAIRIATQTWHKFIKEGVSQEELDNARTSMINRMLASESTVFNKSDEILTQLIKGQLPSVNPVEFTLAKLDKQRSVKNLNETLKRLSDSEIVPVLVIMGNPNDEQIKLLKKIDALDLSHVSELSSLTKPYM